jgi:hypothetical protein
LRAEAAPPHKEGSSMSTFRRRPFVFVGSIVCAALTAGVAFADTAAPAAAAKPRKPASSATVIIVTNSRAVALTELDATPTGGFIPKKIAVNIAPGKKISVSIATDKDCEFNLHGLYADGSNTDSTSVDLCKDKNVNLVN